MDIPNTIIGTIIFIVLIAPMIIINKKILKKRNLFVKKLIDFANEDHKKIIDFDTWTDNSLIGLSEDNELLYFIRNTTNYNNMTKVLIKDIKNCTIKEIKNGTRFESIEFVIELNSQNEHVVLEFFKVDDKNFILGEEMRIAKKWFSKLTEVIPKNKVLLYNF